MNLKQCEIVMNANMINIDNAVKVIESKLGTTIIEYAYILHDKDEGVEPHYHIPLRFSDSNDTKYIAKWFDIPENFISRIKGRWKDVILYMTHKNKPHKFQYSDEEVIASFDYETVVKKAMEDSRKDEIMNMIESGIIREYNYGQYITLKEYDKYKKNIENAYRYRADKLKGANRQMECIYITGDSGSGKTTYAKKFAQDKGMSVFVSSGSNDVLDGYQGEDCLIIDDLRPSVLGLSDLLKMLDNNTASSVKSRYKNKVLECKYLIITTILNIDTFFKNVFSEEDETIVQLKRRCKIHIRMTVDNIYMSLYQSSLRGYGTEMVMENPVKNMFASQEMTEAEMLKYVQETFGELASGVKINKENEWHSPNKEQLELFKENFL